jgi:tyrosinase
MAGLSHIFVAPVETCDNCGRQSQQGVEVTSTAPVTAMLLDYVKLGELENLSPEKVKPFLVQRLSWRVVNVSLI